MERFRAALAGLAVVAAVFGGTILVRTVSRLLRAVVWFAETAALFGLASLVGYSRTACCGGRATTRAPTDRAVDADPRVSGARPAGLGWRLYLSRA